MAWTYDMNGKPVWTGDGQPPLTVTGSNRLPQVVDPRPPMAAVPQQRAPGPAWQGEPLPQPNAAETAALLSGTRSNSPFMTAFSLPGLSSSPLPAVPEGARPPMVATARPPSPPPAPFAESREVPAIKRPVEFPPVVVEATRIPVPTPIVQGRTGVVLGTEGPDGRLSDAMPETEIYRGEMPPSSGRSGSAVPVVANQREYRRFTPMTVAEARAKGLLYDPGQAQREADAVTATQMNIARVRGQLQRDADASMEMTSPAAQAMRGRFDAINGASAMAATMRATGRAGGSKDIVAQILGERREDAASVRRMQEARVTPQVRDGAVYDPFTGVSDVPQRGRPTAQRLETLDDNDILDGLSKFGQPKPMTAKELSQSDPGAWAQFQAEKDPEKKRTYLETPWTDDNKRVYEQYRRQALARGLINPEKQNNQTERTYSPQEAQSLKPGTVYTGKNGKKYTR